MNDEEFELRTTTVPALGAKICLLVAVLALIPTIYFLVAPVQVSVNNGNSFYCGTGISGPKNTFAKGICGKANTLAVTRAASFGISAVALAAGGFLIFGTEKKQQRRRKPGRDLDDDFETDQPQPVEAHQSL